MLYVCQFRLGACPELSLAEDYIDWRLMLQQRQWVILQESGITLLVREWIHKRTFGPNLQT